MKDTVIKETGNSRFLRSSVAEDITFAEFIALLRAGQLPIDLAGINEEGIETLGMALSKENLLNEETEMAIWGNAADRTPTNALKAICEIFSAGLAEKAKIVTGTYTGNGAASRTISLGFTPAAVIICESDPSGSLGGSGYGVAPIGMTVQGVNFGTHTSASALKIVTNGFSVSTNYDLDVTSNNSNSTYSYIAIA